MYHSRLHLTNGIVSAALDALSGEPLELVLESKKENILKNNLVFEASPLKLQLSDGRFLRPAKYMEMLNDATLKPDIAIRQEEKESRAIVSCPALVDMKTGARAEIKAVWTLWLPAGEEKLHWQLTLDSGLDTMVEKAYFPYLNGIWLSDDWTNDTLYMPVHSGDRCLNPTETLSRKPSVISWKWQEYQYDFTLGGPFGQYNGDTGCYERECMYSGPCSMLYTVLSNPELDMSVYLTCRNDALKLKALRAGTYGPERPGVSLSIAHVPCLNKGVWESEESVLMLYEGDWHKGADDYRAWRESVHKPELKRRHRPDWFMKSPGLVAHYDFKYQRGFIVHRFRDIPALYDMAQSFGMNHLLLSGWNQDGFDDGFPRYTPDPDLGTEQELKDALKTVRDRGGHVSFYINVRLCNTKYEDLRELYENGAAAHADGTIETEKYGAGNLTFACMCPNSVPWRERMTQTVDYLTNTIGADSMYLDQLGMAKGLLCYNETHEHGENRGGWNAGYETMLTRMRDTYAQDGVALMFEGASDIHARGASGQLISTMFFNGAYPELFKYTFPDDVLVDMMCPASHSAMRPAHMARKSTFLLYRAFCVGSYFWVYDLEEDNTFRWDAEQLDRLKRVVAIRKAWLDQYGHGTFRDTVGLRDIPQREGLTVKRFDLGNGVLLACANEKKVSASVVVEGLTDTRAVVRSFEHPQEERELTLERVPSGVSVPLGGSELCYIVLPGRP